MRAPWHGRGPDPSTTAACTMKGSFLRQLTCRVEEGVEFLSAAAHVQATCLLPHHAAKKIKLWHKIPLVCYIFTIIAEALSFFFIMCIICSRRWSPSERWGAESYISARQVKFNYAEMLISQNGTRLGSPVSRAHLCWFVFVQGMHVHLLGFAVFSQRFVEWERCSNCSPRFKFRCEFNWAELKGKLVKCQSF